MMKTLKVFLVFCLGATFAQDYDLCTSNPCLHQGTCTVLPDGLMANCTCVEGFSGGFCEIVYNTTCLSDPCENGGVCSDNGGEFECDCLPGFSGNRCEFIYANVPGADVCISSPCLDGGTCIPEADDDFSCVCLDIFSGSSCEIIIGGEVNPPEGCCLSQPCQHGGTCIDSGFTYECQCVPGFTNSNCDEIYDAPCASSPCAHGGTCTVENEDFYNCQCLPGFTSDNCDMFTQGVCLSDPCEHGGTCIATDEDSYECQCLPEFSGLNCHNIGAPCEPDKNAAELH